MDWTIEVYAPSGMRADTVIEFHDFESMMARLRMEKSISGERLLRVVGPSGATPEQRREIIIAGGEPTFAEP